MKTAEALDEIMKALLLAQEGLLKQERRIQELERAIEIAVDEIHSGCPENAKDELIDALEDDLK